VHLLRTISQSSEFEWSWSPILVNVLGKAYSIYRKTRQRKWTRWL